MSLVQIATQHSKTTTGIAGAITGMTSLDVWFLEILPKWVSLAALIAGLILSFIMIRYHLHNTKALKLDNEKKQLEIEAMREEKAAKAAKLKVVS